MGDSLDDQYDRAKRRRRMAQWRSPHTLKRAATRPGHCNNCHTPITWGQLPDGRWLALDPEPVPEGRYALLPEKRTIDIPLGATTLPEVQRHHAHRVTCGVKP